MNSPKRWRLEAMDNLDEVTVSVAWADGTTVETTTRPEEAWDILNRGKLVVVTEAVHTTRNRERSGTRTNGTEVSVHLARRQLPL
jgi:hypothetical protein